MQLTLVMMVKDEEKTIARTIDSALPYVQRAVIVDTGSTDRTIHVAEGALWPALPSAKIHIWASPFVDFATSRNIALETARRAATEGALLLLDAGDVVTNIDSSVLSGNWRLGNIRTMHAMMTKGLWSWRSPRLLDVHSGVEYRGKVHEALDDTPGHPLDKDYFRIEHVAESNVNRWEKDLALLRGRDTRSTLYRGLTYKWLGEKAKARRTFRALLERSLETKVRYECLMSLAEVTPDAQVAYLEKALDLCPYRAEPYYYLAEYFANKDIDLAMSYAQDGCWKYLPEDFLFIREDLYRGRSGMCELVSALAYETKYHETGREHAFTAHDVNPCARTRKNLEYYCGPSTLRSSR